MEGICLGIHDLGPFSGATRDKMIKLPDSLVGLPEELSVISPLTHGVSAMTNDVCLATWRSRESGAPEPVIVKIGHPGIESREKKILTPDGGLGGWLNHRLENEAGLIGFAADNQIPVPKVVWYGLVAGETEVLVLSKIPGLPCFELRKTVDKGEESALEREKGKVLGLISIADVGERSFGPLSKGSETYLNWPEYFNLKVVTTLSLLWASYSQLISLGSFEELAKTPEEWRDFLGKVAGLYSASRVQQLLVEDSQPTLVHGDYWDGNLLAEKKGGTWKVVAIDWERGEIGGKSFDLALWLEWKVGGDALIPDPLEVSADFLGGFKEVGGVISPNIGGYIAIYDLWQYLDFLLIDLNYGQDRSGESVFEIKKLSKQLEAIA